jgi:hypothetical protein
MGEVEEPALSEVEWDLLLGHCGTDIPIEKSGFLHSAALRSE